MTLEDVEKHAAVSCSHARVRLFLKAAAVALVSSLPAVGGVAATVGSPPFVGEDVVYEDVSSSGTVFSAPTLTGNNLNFATNTSFGARSEGAGANKTSPVVTASTSINSVVSRLGEKAISELSVLVATNAKFTKVGTGATFTRATRVSADVAFSVDVLEAGGVALPAPVTLMGQGNIFDLNAVDDPSASPSSGLYTFDLEAEALAQGIVAPITRIDWGVTVTFKAESEATPSTFTIARTRFVGFDQIILAVPEPGVGLLLAAGGGGLLARRRRVRQGGSSRAQGIRGPRAKLALKRHGPRVSPSRGRAMAGATLWRKGWVTARSARGEVN